jgi:hypothetical protein
VGFYFRSTIGSTSAAYEPVDDVTKQVFSDHFIQIYSDAAETAILEFDGARGRSVFDQTLFDDLRQSISAQIGEDRTEELIKGPTEPIQQQSAAGGSS